MVDMTQLRLLDRFIYQDDNIAVDLSLSVRLDLSLRLANLICYLTLYFT